ncbi:ribonuclease H-like domain-containing protein [Russula aff. rugulosa BPL654]|nr:ribonuclease H-like domain-containing protein [Russula aff. rugulosa BPL654]
MFSTRRRFGDVPCPLSDSCNRPICLFSHNPTPIPTPSLLFNVPELAPPPAKTVPAKRPAQSDAPLTLTPQQVPSSSRPSYPANVERPTKLRKTGSAAKPVAVPTASSSPTGVPILTINAGQSKIPVSTRQHALRQEQEIYERTSKPTYRNTVITSIASLKNRPSPTSLDHPSVGTAADIAARSKESAVLTNHRLTRSELEPLLLTHEDLSRWNYLVDIPVEWGPGGESPSADGKIFTCERCKAPYAVRSLDHNPAVANACTYHWGKPLYRSIGGERTRTYTCCSVIVSGQTEGCTRGPHVFYETKASLLHTRYPFSETSPMTSSALDIAALDCEMVYTTGGFRIARVSVVDASGESVFDEFIKMDDGVEVVDLNTRFSGIHPEEYAARAVLPLESIQRALARLIGADTILIGHALDNDLRALRLVHRRVVDTAALFPHTRGPPYRRALRDLTKEFLSRTIQQGGGSEGHSSVEDSVASLDLVKWFVLNKRQSL